MNLDRREFIKVTAMTGGGMALSVTVSASPVVQQISKAVSGVSDFSLESVAYGAVDAQRQLASDFGPFLKLYPDNSVEFFLDRVEMGQGTYTSQVMLLCEEFEYPAQKVKVSQAPVSGQYNNSIFKSQMTGGSTSVAEGHEKLRKAGAIARERIRMAAANEFKVKPEQVTLEAGEAFVTLEPTQRRTFGALASAAAAVSAPKVELKDWVNHKIVGKPFPKLDSRIKSTGQAIYGIDFAPEGSLCAVLLRPPAAGGFAVSFDDSAAKSMPGLNKVTITGTGVAVIADKYWAAKAAAKHVTVSWNNKDAFLQSSDEILALHMKESKESGDSARSEGDYAQAFRAAATHQKVQGDYILPYLAHATMEPQNATCRFIETPQKGQPKIEIWAPSQVPDVVVALVAAKFGVNRSEVVYHNCLLGGGFGRRLSADYIFEAVEVAQASQSDKPVQVIWSREDDMKHDDFRPMAVCHMLGSVDNKGKLSSFFYRHAGQSIIRQFAPTLLRTLAPQWVPSGLTRLVSSAASSFAAGAVAVEGAKDMAYKCPNVRIEFREIKLPIRVGFWRSVGHSVNGFVMESFIDELAHVAGKDPYSFRREHLDDADRRAQVLDRVVKLAGWGQKLSQGVFEGIAVHKSFESYVAQVARVSVQEKRVRVLEVFCAVDCGHVVNPLIVKSQMESGIVYGLSAMFAGEIEFSKGEVVQNNFNDYPVLRHSESPKVTVEIVESNEKPTGVGEPGTPPIAAAVCNAIFKATGVRIRQLPLSRSFV